MLSLALGHSVDEDAAEMAFRHPSVDIGAWVHDLHGVYLPDHVQAWIGAVLVSEPWPERDLVLHLATALWLVAGLWEYCALRGEWGSFVGGDFISVGVRYRPLGRAPSASPRPLRL